MPENKKDTKEKKKERKIKRYKTSPHHPTHELWSNAMYKNKNKKKPYPLFAFSYSRLTKNKINHKWKKKKKAETLTLPVLGLSLSPSVRVFSKWKQAMSLAFTKEGRALFFSKKKPGTLLLLKWLGTVRQKRNRSKTERSPWLDADLRSGEREGKIEGSGGYLGFFFCVNSLGICIYRPKNQWEDVYVCSLYL